MLRVVTKITVEQQPNDNFKTRNKVLFFDFINSWEAASSWENLTDKAKVVLPKNVYYLDELGNKINLGNINTNLGGFSSGTPTFLRGDKLTIVAGYISQFGGRELEDTATIFQGYISNVSSKKTFTLECEDSMYKLKQLPAPNKVFSAKSYTLEGMLKELLAGSGFTVNALTKTSIGDFRTQNETVADVLARLRKDYHFEAYFRGNELRCGALVYVPEDTKEHVFVFSGPEGNVIDDSKIAYQRKDDVVLSAVAYSINKIELSGTTKDGHKKTKHERLEVLVTFQNGKFTYKAKTPGDKKSTEFAPNTIGERRTFYFWNVTTIEGLVELAKAELQKYYYTGLKGTFTTFGIPFVKHGDNVISSDPALPERKGTYKVKGVEYSGGFDVGLRQEIKLDYRILVE